MHWFGFRKFVAHIILRSEKNFANKLCGKTLSDLSKKIVQLQIYFGLLSLNFPFLSLFLRGFPYRILSAFICKLRIRNPV